MRRGIFKILVTGGAGFIGSEFVRFAAQKNYKIIVLDKLTYAGDLKRLTEVKKKIVFYKADICDYRKVQGIFSKERPDSVVHFAAETHVDRSICDAAPFLETNIKGTQVLLEASLKHKAQRFVHISTDEVYGEVLKGKFTEDSPFHPNSPYAVSKAAADMLVQSYQRTYRLPAVIIRPCNNYGPWQYPEKLIPVALARVFNNQPIPVYARGLNVREWLYVGDCAEGIFSIMKKGRIGQAYNLGSDIEKRNIDVASLILKLLGKDSSLIKFVSDRPGHDLRYRLSSQKAYRETGWQPEINFESGLRQTIGWYCNNRSWLAEKK